MTSTMKSDPGMPLTRASSRGVSVSAAFAEGGRAEGARGACATVSAARTGGLIADAAVAAPAATTPVRNLRRSAFGPVSLSAIVFSYRGSRPGGDSNPGRIAAPRVGEVRGRCSSRREAGDCRPHVFAVQCPFMLDWSTCEAVERNPDVVSGAWVFRGTRVPVHALFENLEGGATVAQFMEWFPGVARAQVEAVLEHAARSLHPA